jgi:hypothetical protein
MTSLTDKSADAPFDNLNQQILMGSPEVGPTQQKSAISSPHEIEEGEFAPHSEEHERLHRLLQVPVVRRIPVVVRRVPVPLLRSVVPLPKAPEIRQPRYEVRRFQFPDIMVNRSGVGIWGSDLFAKGKKRRRL